MRIETLHTQLDWYNELSTSNVSKIIMSMMCIHDFKDNTQSLKISGGMDIFRNRQQTYLIFDVIAFLITASVDI